MLVDWLLVQRRSTPSEVFFERPRTVLDWINPAAAVAFFIGLAFNLWAHLILPTVANEQLPLSFIGALIAAALYAGFARLSPRAVPSRRRAATRKPLITS